MTLQKKELGTKGEGLAVRYLKRLGYRILERNYRIRLGEIDIIAEKDKDLVFVEVKTRADTIYGSPLESVTLSKQRQLSKVALEYLSRKGWHNRPARFDVVGIQVMAGKESGISDAKIELVQNAFELCFGND